MEFLIAYVTTRLFFFFVGFAFLTTLLLLWVIARQRKMKRILAGFEKYLSQSIQDLEDQSRVNGDRQVAKIGEALQALDPFKQAILALDKKFDHIEKTVVGGNENLQSSIMEFNTKDEPGMDSVQTEITRVRESVDLMKEELARAHDWLEELRILEKVVVNLIGQDKLRTLLEQEKRQAGVSKPAAQRPGNKRNSIL